MWFVLFLDLNNLEYYGYIPEIPKDREGRVEIYRFDVTREHWDLLLDDFIDPVCNLCEALIDIGDVDFLNADKLSPPHYPSLNVLKNKTFRGL